MVDDEATMLEQLNPISMLRSLMFWEKEEL
jgi:hypothetical protein